MDPDDFKKSSDILDKEIKRLQRQEMAAILKSFIDIEWKYYEGIPDRYYATMKNYDFIYYPSNKSFYIEQGLALMGKDLSPEEFKIEYKKILLHNFK